MRVTAREFKQYLRYLVAKLTRDRYTEMEVREAVLRACIENEQRKYQEAIMPYVKALSIIQSCKPPQPIVSDDGRSFVYVGPQPVWTKRGAIWPK